MSWTATEVMLHACMYRPYSRKLLTINNYVNCPSNFAFACSIYLFHPPIFEKILMRIPSITVEPLFSGHHTVKNE